jgi:hypothetical protein
VVLQLIVFLHSTIVQEAIIVQQAHTAQLMMEQVVPKVVESVIIVHRLHLIGSFAHQAMPAMEQILMLSPRLHVMMAIIAHMEPLLRLHQVLEQRVEIHAQVVIIVQQALVKPSHVLSALIEQTPADLWNTMIPMVASFVMQATHATQEV